MHVTFEQAHQIIEASVKKSKEIGVKSCIAVIDSGGNLKAFSRMDDAALILRLKKQRLHVILRCPQAKSESYPCQAPLFTASNIRMMG